MPSLELLSILGRHPLARRIALDTELVDAELQRYARQAEDPRLTDVLLHLFSSGGKRLRPALVLLAAHWGTYEQKRAVQMAAAMEMIHAASLVHDDIIDEASVRRGKPTANEVWDTKTAVLSGDYLFALAADVVAAADNVKIMAATARTIMALCSGEISQSARSYRWRTTREEYFRYVGQKTASLTSLCCSVGASISGASDREIDVLSAIGARLGTAFQIVDDVLDLTADQGKLGKPIGLDIDQGMITLPVIQALDTPAGRRLNGALVDGQRPSAEAVRMLVSVIQTSGAIDESYAVARQYLREAQDLIRGLGESDAASLLVRLLDYAVNRTS